MADTLEQQARDLLERMGWEDAQALSAGDLSELTAIMQRARHYTLHEAIQLASSFEAKLEEVVECVARAGAQLAELRPTVAGTCEQCGSSICVHIMGFLAAYEEQA